MLSWLLGGLVLPDKVLSVSIAGAAAGDIFCPGSCLPGQPLEILGRLPPTPRLKIDLELQRGDRSSSQHHEIDLGAASDDVFLGRTWAQKKITSLDPLAAVESKAGDSPEVCCA